MATFKDRHGKPRLDTSDEPFIYHGEELTDDRAEEIARDAVAAGRRRGLIPGGKSLSGGRKHSPTVQFRVPEDLRDLLDERAEVEHRSPSRIAREALEKYLTEID